MKTLLVAVLLSATLLACTKSNTAPKSSNTSGVVYFQVEAVTAGTTIQTEVKHVN